jgi:hypothetical protein
MDLYRYSLDAEHGNLRKPADYVLKLRSSGRASPIESYPYLYLTCDKLGCGQTRDLLSLTYVPRYRYKINSTLQNLSLEDNIGHSVSNQSDGGTVDRVWPAFGRPGGAHELLLVDYSGQDRGLTVGLLPDQTFDEGGEFDEYSQHDREAFDITELLGIGEGLVGALRESDLMPQDLGVGDRGLTVGKTTPSGVVVRGERGRLRYTLSLALKGLSQGPGLHHILFGVQIVGSVWEDDYDLPTRRSRTDIVEQVQVFSPRSNFGLAKNSTRSLWGPINDKVRLTVKRLVSITRSRLHASGDLTVLPR